MVFSGSVVVDHEDRSGLCGGRPCLVASTPATATDGRPRTSRRAATAAARGRSTQANPVLDLGRKDFRDPKVFWHAPTGRWVMVSVLPDEHKVRFFGIARPQALGEAERLRSRRRPGGRVGVPGPLRRFPWRASRAMTRWVLDVDVNPGGLAGRLRRPVLRGHVRRRPLHERRAAHHDALGRLRQGLLRHPVLRRLVPCGRAAGLDGLDEQLAVRERRAHLALARGAVGSARARAPAPARGLAARPDRRCRSSRALRTAKEPLRVSRAATLPGSADIELEVVRGAWPGRGPPPHERGRGRGRDRSDQGAARGVRGPPALAQDAPSTRPMPAVMRVPVRWQHAAGDRVRLRILFDRSTLEVFANDGETVISDRLFPTEPLTRVEVIGAGTAVPEPALLHELRSVWRASP